MTPLIPLGGFKILNNMVRFSLILPDDPGNLAAGLCRSISQKKINLPYITCIRCRNLWRLNIMVEADDGLRTSLSIREKLEDVFLSDSGSAIMSIFPHKKNLEIPGRIFKVFSRNGIGLDALANSPSAISLVLKEDSLNIAGDALFEAFSFSAFRTPDDWKLAQKGKEEAYKEIVANYQEQSPKVYGLEYYSGQELVTIKLPRENIFEIANSFTDYARIGSCFTFLSTGPSLERNKIFLIVCLSRSKDHPLLEIIDRSTTGMETGNIFPVAVFSMTGPHFGDRYGIAGELLSVLVKNGIDLLCLSCTIASVTGVVPSRQMDASAEAIKEFFDVPAIVIK